MANRDKNSLRKEFLSQRDALDPALRLRHSSLIRQRVFGHPAWKNAERILCYVSFGSEVETHTLIQEALRFKKQIVVPVHDPDKSKTPISRIERFVELGVSHRGILQVQPQFVRAIDPAQIQLALIPGIAFDKTGGRLGFGGGYFDRLLPQMSHAFRMALAYTAQFTADPLPHEAHDVMMQAIVTEKETLSI